MSDSTTRPSASRRDFLKTTAVAAGAAVATQLTVPAVHAAGDDQIKVGLIGCGGRGTQACENVLSAAKGVTIHALGDVFEFQLNHTKDWLPKFVKEAKGGQAARDFGNTVNVEGRCFSGLDAYKQVIDSGVNYIILATPPGFRPIHLQAAVEAGKTIFTEKPVGVDGPGIRKVLEAYEAAKTKGLHIAAGTQRRHDPRYIETIKRVREGAIGELVGGQAHWMQNILWERVSAFPRHPELTSDVSKQIFNWYAHVWLCGDHIVEQHVHNIDVLNWAFGHHPESALGMGFRTRTDPRYGPIYDFFAIDYAYPKGVHTTSMCRQIAFCDNDVGEYLQGTKGTCEPHAHSINGKNVAPKVKKGFTPYVQEHTDLIESVRSGKPLNELKQVAESTLTAIMGRMSAYTGKRITWKAALDSKEDTMPANLTLDMSLAEAPLPIPGKKKFI